MGGSNPFVDGEEDSGSPAQLDIFIKEIRNLRLQNVDLKVHVTGHHHHLFTALISICCRAS